jgi:hypothetical protein
VGSFIIFFKYSRFFLFFVYEVNQISFNGTKNMKSGSDLLQRNFRMDKNTIAL